MSDQYAIYSEEKTGVRKAIRRPIPSKPGKNEILIKNVAVASNPKDWKTIVYMSWKGIEGNDTAGYVEAVGEGVTEFKKGQHVAALTRMRTADDYGVYQEYSLAPIETTFQIAESTSFEEAATLPLAVMTAAIGLYIKLGLPEPSYPVENKDTWIAVNGASSSVGSFAVQLAKLSGLKVFGIAGAGSQIAKEFGADEVVDYRNYSNDQLAETLEKEFTSKKITKVYDAVSSKETQAFLAKALQSSGGEITVVLQVHDVDPAIQNVRVLQTLVGTAYPKYDDGDKQNSEFAAKWYKQLGKWLDQGVFKGNRAKVMPHGLDSVDEGLKLLEDNKVSGEKLVYRILDTPNLKK